MYEVTYYSPSSAYPEIKRVETVEDGVQWIERRFKFTRREGAVGIITTMPPFPRVVKVVQGSKV